MIAVEPFGLDLLVLIREAGSELCQDFLFLDKNEKVIFFRKNRFSKLTF